MLLPNGVKGRVAVHINAATTTPELCLLTNDTDLALGSCTSDSPAPLAKLVGAAPARPQGPVENQDADITGNYNTGLVVRALGALTLGWDGGAVPAYGYMVNPGDGGSLAFQSFPLPLDGGTLGICQGFTEAGVPSLVSCGNGDAGGITQITQDLLAGPGTGSVTGTVVGIQKTPVSDAAPDANESLVYSSGSWAPALVNLPNGVTGTLTVQLGGTGINDAGTAANLCVLTDGSGGLVIGACAGSFTPALDLISNPDGGAGQVVVAAHGPSDGGLVAWYNPGIAADPAQTDLALKYAGEAGVSAVPGDIDFWAQRPNKGSSTAPTQSPGEINENLFHPIGSGSWPTWNVVAADDCTGGVGCSYQWAMGQIGPSLPLADGGVQVAPSAYLWGSVLPGAVLTSNNYTMYTSGGTNGTTNINSPGYITLNVGNNIYEGIDIFKPGIGQVTAITAAGGSTIGMSAFVFNYPSVNPVYGILPTISNTATTSVSLIGQSSNSGATGANLAGGPAAICGGEHAGSTGATDGVVTLGAGYTLTTYPQCNVTETIDGQGALFQSSGGAPSCVSGKGRVGADSSGNMWGCDSSGSAYRLNAGGSTAAATGVYGNGVDGAYVLDGSTNFAPLIVLASPNIYGFQADVFATTVVVNTGVFVEMNGYVLHANGSVTVNTGGTLDANSGNEGNNGLSGSGGAGGSVGNTHGVLGGGFRGGAGGLGSAGSNGVSTTNSWVLTSTFQPPNGGAGGNAGGTSGGTGSVTTAVGCRTLSLPGAALGTCTAPMGGVWGVYQIQGGGGGGGGASLGAGGAGGGGGSAGVGVIASPTITNNGLISSNGGQGGNGFVGTGSGGGGGGAGGLIYLITGSFTGTAPNVTGGVGGSGASGGAAGVTGDTGYVVHLGP